MDIDKYFALAGTSSYFLPLLSLKKSKSKIGRLFCSLIFTAIITEILAISISYLGLQNLEIYLAFHLVKLIIIVAVLNELSILKLNPKFLVIPGILINFIACFAAASIGFLMISSVKMVMVISLGASMLAYDMWTSNYEFVQVRTVISALFLYEFSTTLLVGSYPLLFFQNEYQTIVYMACNTIFLVISNTLMTRAKWK